MEKIVLGKKKGMIVVEDCAQTCGGDYKGKNLGLGEILVVIVFKKLKL